MSWKLQHFYRLPYWWMSSLTHKVRMHFPPWYCMSWTACLSLNQEKTQISQRARSTSSDTRVLADINLVTSMMLVQVHSCLNIQSLSIVFFNQVWHYSTRSYAWIWQQIAWCFYTILRQKDVPHWLTSKPEPGLVLKPFHHLFKCWIWFTIIAPPAIWNDEMP